jgi:hypothetical protein
MNIKLVSNNFADIRSPMSKHMGFNIDWREPVDDSDYVIFTDQSCFNSYEGKGQKIAWLIEPSIINGEMYQKISKEENFSKCKYVCSHFRNIENAVPNFIYSFHGGTWLRPEDINIWDKNKLCSMIFSHKQWNAGHRYRFQAHENLKTLNSNVDFFGSGSGNPVDFKISGLKDYMFSIAMENCTDNDYFTEKLIDCFLSGCIPIYFGTKNIVNYFNKDGIILVDGPLKIAEALENLNQDFYNDRREAIEDNFERAKVYANPAQSIINFLNGQD